MSMKSGGSAASRKRPAPGRTQRGVHPRDEVRLSRKNWMILGGAIGVIIAGYIALASGSITLAPLLLVLGYCVLVPYAILARD